MRYPINDPRGCARQIVRESIDSELWSRNEAFTHKLVDMMRKHRLYHHPIVEAWSRNEFTLEGMAIVHLEIRAGFLEVFTESLLRLMQTASHLEGRLGARAKMAARFLIQLNVLEELGFKPDAEGTGEFCGHPAYSHYWQLRETLTLLGAPEESWASYVPTAEALATRKSLEDNHDDHLRLAAVLASIETAFVPYYNPWAQNTIAVCKETDISDGYHTIHIGDDAGHSVDDDHSEDSWYIVRQSLTPDRYAEIETLVKDVLDLWARFMDAIVDKHRELLKRAA
jgi:hypothetical protein